MSDKRLNPRANLERRVAILSALGDIARLGLVATLCSGPPRPISEFAHESKLISHGLTRLVQTLEQCGLLHRSRAARKCIFEFRPQPLKEIESYLKVSPRSGTERSRG
jgi:predicted transcriptional regulator